MYILLNLSLYVLLSYITKLSGYSIGIKFDKTPLTVKNYLSKTIHVYIVYDLNVWPRNPTNNFKFKNCLVGANNVAKV